MFRRQPSFLESGQTDPDYEATPQLHDVLPYHGRSRCRGSWAWNRPSKRALFEDLGDLSLCAYLRFPHDAASLRSGLPPRPRHPREAPWNASEHADECPLLASRDIRLRPSAMGDRVFSRTVRHRSAERPGSRTRKASMRSSISSREPSAPLRRQSFTATSKARTSCPRRAHPA